VPKFPKARVICNPASRGGAHDPEVLEPLLEDLSAEWKVTGEPGDATRYAREWREGLLIVAGGDGTVNEAVNGIGQSGFPQEVTLAILPAGTGNDLAATLAIPADPEQAAEVVRAGEVRTIDAARIRSRGGGEQFFANVATGGLGARISEAVDPELKSRWGRLAYLRASLEAAESFEPRELHLTLDGKECNLRAVNVAVGNCRYAGGGWPAAPRANPEDGLLDLVVIEDIGMRDLLTLGPRALTQSDYLDAEGVFFARAANILVETSPLELEFTADGEVMGEDPAEFTVLPRSLRVVVGPEYTPEVRG
jgi:diacylglycerol kinase (ATP)